METIQTDMQKEMELVLVEGAKPTRMKDAKKYTVSIKIGGAEKDGIRIDKGSRTDEYEQDKEEWDSKCREGENNG